MATFNGTLASDVFGGSAANDIFNYGIVTKDADGVVTAGRGQDTISSGGGFDLVTFANLSSDHFDVNRVGNDFVLHIQPTTDWNEGEEVTNLGGVTITNFFAADGNGVIDRFNLTNGYVLAAYTAGIARFEFFSPTNVLLRTSIDGSPANDVINGTAGVDELSGMLGNDTLRGLAGNDELNGDAGNDRLDGGAGNDKLSGDIGNDTLIGGPGDDTVHGGDGTDTVDYSPAAGPVVANLGQFSVRGASTASNVGTDTVYFVERLVGSAFDDILVGGGGFAVTLLGGDGNDVLTGAHANDSLVGGAGADFFDASASGTTIGGLGNDTMDGSAVLDRINYLDGNGIGYASSNGPVSLNLQAGTALDGVGGTDTLRNINFVTGSAFNDSLVGSNALVFESFTGGPGNDTIDGGAITDTLSVRNANRASYSSAASAVQVDLAAGTATGQGDDTLRNINYVQGSDFADALAGSNRSDVNETLEGRGGNDVLNGRGGNDTARYQYATNGVSVNLVTGIAFVSASDQDTLSGIEGLRGSHYNDSLVGGHAANAALEFYIGNGGNDTINGGAGYDRVDYANSMQGVSVTLGGTAAGTAKDGMPILNGAIQYPGTAGAVIGTDTLRNIEAVRGSDFNDTLTGSAIATEETFEGRGGNDTIDGGAGPDRVSYFVSPAGVTVALGLSGAAGTAADGWGGTDTLRRIENVQGSRDFADRITGNELANGLDGLGGNDSLVGGAGNDSLVGGSGNDTLIGSAGNDSLTGGSGLDRFRFASALNASGNVDRLADFVAADDTLQLDDAVFVGIGATGTLSAAAFHEGSAAADASDRIVYDSGTGRLYFDPDGSGSAPQVLFATVEAGTAIGAVDFFVV